MVEGGSTGRENILGFEGAAANKRLITTDLRYNGNLLVELPYFFKYDLPRN